MKKAFTLIELMTVVAILAIIALIVTPAVNAIITSSKENAYEEQIDRLIASSYTYTTMETITSESGKITFEQLISSGLLPEHPIDPMTNEQFEGCMIYEWDGLEYTFYHSINCVLNEDDNLGNIYACSTWDNWKDEANAGTDFDFDPETGTILDYKGESYHVIIPCEIDGVEVKQIGLPSYAEMSEYRKIHGSYAFSYKDLVSVQINDNIEMIGTFGFFANSLKSINIPNSVTDIRENAFTYNLLTSLTIPDSVTKIGYSAFSHNEITEFKMSANIKEFGGGAFTHNNFSLEDAFIYGYDENGNYDTSILNSYGSDPVDSLIIPSQVKIVQRGAALDQRMSSVILPDGLEIIEEFGFSSSLLSSISIPSSVIKIERYSLTTLKSHITVYLKDRTSIPTELNFIEAFDEQQNYTIKCMGNADGICD